jgi:RNA polymerase sigma-70 factor (ECF subfamily)
MVLSECGATPPPAFADETALLAAIVARDQTAFAELYDRYSTPAYRLAYQLLGERGAAEDVVQEVFLAIWRRAADFDATRGNVQAWLLTSVRHAAISRLRGKHGRARFDVTLDALADFANGDDPHATAEANERRTLVRRGLGILPAAQREAIELAYFAELTCEEIAARTAVALGTTKGRLRLARGRLRTILAPAVM